MAGKMVFGTNKLGRQRRVITCNASTFDGCEWMPNFKQTGRGCVLKVSNDELIEIGIKKRSQIDKINGVDHGNHGFKKIRKLLKDNIDSGTEFTVTIMTGELSVKTVEIFFRGAFCPSVEFCAEGDGTNFIIENIPYDDSSKVLIDKGDLRRGWRVTKVKNTKVTGKKYDEISKMILSASNDMRVDYSVMFEEGNMSWYNFEEPPKKKEPKHQRSGSGRFARTKVKRSSRNTSHKRGKSRGRKNKGSHTPHSMSCDVNTLAQWKYNSEKRDSSSLLDNISESSSQTPTLTSLAESNSFETFEANNGDEQKNNVSKRMQLRVIHSGNLHIDSADVNATVSDGAIETLQVTKEVENNTKHSKKKSVSFGDGVSTKSRGRAVDTATKKTHDKEQRSKSLSKLKLESTHKHATKSKVEKVEKAAKVAADKVEKVEKAEEKVVEKVEKIEAVDVTVMCDLCERMFVIKDDELKYHSLNETEHKTASLEDTENEIEGKKKDEKNTKAHNGLCKECVQWECTVEVNRLDAVMLAPHGSGHGVEICYVAPHLYNKHIKWISEQKEAVKEKDEKKEDKKKKKKEKHSDAKHMKITAHFRILAINDVNVDLESFETIFAMYYRPSTKKQKQKRIKLKLKKHFSESHTQIVESYYEHKNELLALKRKAEEQREAELQRKALLTRNTNKTMVDSDPDDDNESHSDSEEDIPQYKSRKKSRKRHKRWGKSKSKSLKSLHARHEYEESDYGYEPKSVAQLIEEHDGMVFIKEGEKLEAEGNWEMAGMAYERGVSMLEDYQKILRLTTTSEKRMYRQQLAEYRRKMLLIQNRLIRKTATPRINKEKENEKKERENDKNNNDDEDDKKEKINKDKKDPDKAFKDRLTADIITEAPGISFKDVTGLLNVKLALYECVILPQKRPELFTGLRKPTAGLLLFGPPGNGKTMIAKCVATECDATFFSISASSITSKWVGEAERTMRTLFNLAREKQPSIIFIDEIDSLLTARGGKNEAGGARKIKTEFLVQFDGVKATADGKEARVLVIGATNLPDQLDEAVLRRFGKRILVPVPDEDARYGILRHLAAKQENNLKEEDFRKIVQKTNLYSASDLTQVCKDASMGPLRDLGSAVLDNEEIEVPPMEVKHFESALKNVRASVKQESLIAYQKWDSKFGSKLTFALSALPKNMHAHPIEPLD